MKLFRKKSSQPDPAEEDSNRSALFGNRKPKPAAENPYADPKPSPAPSGYGGSAYGDRPPASRAESTYSGSTLVGGNNGGYGGGGGYGSGGYGKDNMQGGYGQRPPIDRQPSTSTLENNKAELFGNARERVAQRQQAQGLAPREGGYGAPNREGRELTAEEEEEEDVEAIKQQIRFVKQESVASTRNALRAAAQAEETGRDTLTRLGAQGERLYNTEKNLDLAESTNRRAEESARELKTLNRSMFAVHVKNPFNSAQRNADREAAILAQHEMEKESRERTRQFGYESRSAVDNALNASQRAGAGGYGAGRNQMSLAERSKYQFEADESDDEKEREIESNLDAIGAAAGRLKGLALATQGELDRQNKQINNIIEKVRRLGCRSTAASVANCLCRVIKYTGVSTLIRRESRGFIRLSREGVCMEFAAWGFSQYFFRFRFIARYNS